MSEGTDVLEALEDLHARRSPHQETWLVECSLISAAMSEIRDLRAGPSDREWTRAIEFQRLKFIRQVVVATTRNMNLTDINDFPSASAMVTEAATKAWELHAAPRKVE